MSESRSGEQQELIERFQAEVSERFAADGAATAELVISNIREAAEQAFYVVGILNGTDTAFTVVIAYITSDNSQQARYIRKELPPGVEPIPFVLTPRGQCARLLAYVMGFFVDDQIAFRSPEEGAWTPERISQEFPSDQDPCVDLWALG